MTVPFGRWRGFPLPEIPADYLQWLAGLDDMRPWLRRAVEAEIQRRATRDDACTTLPSRPCPAPETARELIGAGLRALARQHHPDVGGTHEDMIRVTAAANWLRSVVGGAA